MLRRYANRLDLAHDLGRLLGQRAVRGAAAGLTSPYEAGMARRGRQRRVLGALPEQDVQQIAARFAAGGTPKHLLAAEYGMSLSSLKRLLRRQRARIELVSLAPACGSSVLVTPHRVEA